MQVTAAVIVTSARDCLTAGRPSRGGLAAEMQGFTGHSCHPPVHYAVPALRERYATLLAGALVLICLCSPIRSPLLGAVSPEHIPNLTCRL